jgi:glycosyltransferase involved in cell wall biosynthesis
VRLLSVGSLPPELGGAERGGVATFHAALLEGLTERPTEIEVVGVMAPDPLSGRAPFPVFARSALAQTAAFYEDLLERLEPDVVLLNHVANTVGVTHARLEAAPPAVGIAHSWHNITFRFGELRRDARAVTQEALGGLTALVTPSRHCRQEGERLDFAYPVPTRTIHYPLQPLYLEDGIDVEAAGERDGVLYVGSLIRRKNPAKLVEAAASLPRVPVTLVGKGKQEERLAAQIEELGLQHRVRLDDLAGPDHLQRLRDLFLRSGVVCLPSDSESFGIVFIEALACGTPVVGFGPTVREIREQMGIEIGVPLDEPSPEEIAVAIEDVMATSWDRAALRRAAVASFDLTRTTEIYADLLIDCAKRGRDLSARF